MVDDDEEFRFETFLLSCRRERRRLCAVMESSHTTSHEKVAALSELSSITQILTALAAGVSDWEN